MLGLQSKEGDWNKFLKYFCSMKYCNMRESGWGSQRL
uniref:Uncharacterized protein n=1 Tax=Anguilla anguilla TaxID=7936 RepID=A0A0E9PAB3_ANGAN